MKIAVIGYSGAGKSTLAAGLAEFYGLPLLYLDTVQFTAGWRERDRDEARSMAAEFMKQDGWVIDGNYAGFYQKERLSAADLIVFLDFPRRICFPAAVKRRFQYRGRARESMAEGCGERLDPAFLCWLLWRGRTKAHRAHYREICQTYPEKTAVLKNRREVRRFCAGLGMAEEPGL